MTKIDNCPFCGSDIITPYRALNSFADCELHCSVCGANHGCFDNHGDDDEAYKLNLADAIKQWNYRKTIPKLKQQKKKETKK